MLINAKWFCRPLHCPRQSCIMSSALNCMPPRPLLSFICEFSGRSELLILVLLARVTDTISRSPFPVQENMNKVRVQQNVSWLKINDFGTTSYVILSQTRSSQTEL